MVDRIERCALITDESWLEKVASVAARLAPFEVKEFAPGDRDDAVAWVS